ncbi:MAG TPA: hypothetical protein VL201_00805 [Patescibacteria group bacterium]|jgi:hypothetical protein|nr:hypothetical protein [Patescibacteria group bacterium]
MSLFYALVLLSIVPQFSHALAIKKTTELTIIFDGVPCIYSLDNSYIEGSFFSKNLNSFQEQNGLIIRDPNGDSMDKETLDYLLIPLTLKPEQQSNFFAQYSIDDLNTIYNYYYYWNMPDIVKKQIHYRCLAKWFFQNDIQCDSKNIKECIDIFYREYEIYSTKVEDKPFNRILLMPLVEMQGENLLTFYLSQSYEGLETLYENMPRRTFLNLLKNSIALCMLLKKCEYNSGTDLLKEAIITRYVDEKKKGSVCGFDDKYECKKDDDKQMINLFIKNLINNKNNVHSFEHCFLRSLFISKAKGVHCLHVNTLADIDFLRQIDNQLLGNIQLLKIDEFLLNSDNLSKFENIRKVIMPSLKKIKIIMFTNNNNDKYFFTRFITSIFYINPHIFSPVEVYISNKVPEINKKYLLHYKNFLFISGLKSYINNDGLAIVGGSVLLYVFVLPMIYLFCSKKLYSYNELCVQAAVITILYFSLFKAFTLHGPRGDKYVTTFFASAILLVILYTYQFYLSVRKYQALYFLLKTFFYTSPVFFVGLQSVSLCTHVRNRENFIRWFKMLRYRNTIFSL